MSWKFGTYSLELYLFFAFLFLSSSCLLAGDLKREKTAFQTSSFWKPELDVRGDVAIIYGTKTQEHLRFGNKPMTFEKRLRSWQDRGYITHFMTGVAWGEYQDYFNGEWDGKKHLDEGQKKQNGEIIWHHQGVPYVIPTISFLEYMKTKHIKVAIDAGIDAIYLEEPEFWAFAGYSDAFKREWKEFYGFDWRAQDESVENLYLSNKLKYHLFYRALNECFTYAKEYGKSIGKEIRCYVPTHSLINYSQWQIVSPEASLASLPCVDGYIAQVWTGTSRVPNYYNGKWSERVFEGAFMEYGTLESMTAPTGRKVFFLTDPIEDRPRDWEDYIRNYEATFTAKLLYPGNDNYEIMPWPERIYEGLYQVSANSKEKAKVPRSFSTQMQVMINALGNMPLSDNKVSGTQGISVLMANSLMFQRNDIPVEGYEDPQLSNFFGLVMPLLKKGVPVKTLHIENTSYPDAWRDTHILLMTYSNMKPLNSEGNEYIAEWVRRGGKLLYSSRDDDPFQTVQEWWNTGTNHYKTPAEHLFRLLGMEADPSEGVYHCGKGIVQVLRYNPKEFVMQANNDMALLRAVENLYGAPLEYKNNFTLDRGPYHMVAVMNESVTAEAYRVKGLFIDLFNPELPVVTEKLVNPGMQAFLYDINKAFVEKKPQVLASASRVSDEKINNSSYSFIAKSPKFTTNVMRVWLPAAPKKVLVTNAKGETLMDCKKLWDKQSQTYFLGFENDPDGVHVELVW